MKEKTKKIPFGPFFLDFSSKVQNLAVFSTIYMIRIRFSGSRELFKRHFSRARYMDLTPTHSPL